MGEYAQSSPSNSLCDQTRSFSGVNMHRNHLGSGGNAGSDSAALSWGMCTCVYASVAQPCLFVTPWTVAHQAPLSMGFFRQEYWNGLPFSSSRDLPGPGIEPASPALRADSLPAEPSGSPSWGIRSCISNITPPVPLGSQPATLSLLVWGPHVGEPGGQSSLSAAADSH